MKTVYVLFEEIPYGEDIILGILSDLKKLIAYQEKWYNNEKTHWIDFEIDPEER